MAILRIDAPKGLTARKLATDLSRGNPFSVSGSKVHMCRHLVMKRRNADFYEHDRRDGHPHVCGCCENWYSKHSDVPGPCPICQGGQ